MGTLYTTRDTIARFTFIQKIAFSITSHRQKKAICYVDCNMYWTSLLTNVTATHVRAIKHPRNFPRNRMWSWSCLLQSAGHILRWLSAHKRPMFLPSLPGTLAVTGSGEIYWTLTSPLLKDLQTPCCESKWFAGQCNNVRYWKMIPLLKHDLSNVTTHLGSIGRLSKSTGEHFG